MTDESQSTYFDMLPNKIRDFTRKLSTVVDGTRWHFFYGYHTVCKQNTVIIVTEGGGLVDNTCTVGIGDIVVNKNPKCPGFVLCNK